MAHHHSLIACGITTLARSLQAVNRQQTYVTEQQIRDVRMFGLDTEVCVGNRG